MRRRAQELKISLDGAKRCEADRGEADAGGEHGERGDDGGDELEIADPKRVVPVESTVKGVGKEFTRTVPGYSIEVLEFISIAACAKSGR
jgi:hypothetical protein